MFIFGFRVMEEDARFPPPPHRLLLTLFVTYVSLLALSYT